MDKNEINISSLIEEISNEIKTQGKSIYKIAKETGMTPPTIWRLVRGGKTTTLTTFLLVIENLKLSLKIIKK